MTVAAAGVALPAAPALASGYGPGAVYEIELSANASGPQGGGLWLWIALYPDGTGDYSGADCGHGGARAAHESGDVTWTDSASSHQLTIKGVTLNGLGGFPTTVTVPDTYGHYTGTLGTYETLPRIHPTIHRDGSAAGRPVALSSGSPDPSPGTATRRGVFSLESFRPELVSRRGAARS